MSTRRHGGGGNGAVKSTTATTTTRSVTPLATSRKLPSLSSSSSKFSSSIEKENTNPRRSISRGSVSNPTQKPITRPVPRLDRRSSSGFSSLPRGRSPSPSELSKTRRASVDRVNKDPNRLKQRSDPNMKSTEKARSAEKVKPLTTSFKGYEKKDSETESKVEKENNKYPSRLHEKLAFLEGKVKRIASDIKKTKEMLDLNNPDASKLMLTDIQDKISGIEKAIVHVVSNDDDNDKNDNKKQLGQSGVVVHVDDNNDDGVQDLKTDDDNVNKSLVKGLNNEELEARLFPHHKLLRDRNLKEKEKVEGKVLGVVDDSSIELEFLASLDKGNGKVSTCNEVKETDVVVGGGNGGGCSSGVNGSSLENQKCRIDVLLEADEKLEEFDDREDSNDRQEGEFVGEEIDEAFNFKLNEIGNKIASAGWFVAEGEAVLLAHDDASCSYYDIANCEEKAVYMPPPGVSPNIWRDCWVIRAPGSDGCSGRFVVAASAGNTIDSGFCAWDFYTKEVKAFQVEVGKNNSRTALRPLSNNVVQRRNSSILAADARQWWYRPCGPLMISTSSSQKAVKVFDVRDGEQVMKWDVQKPVQAMEYSSPLQWRNRGKVVVAEAESISLWDVNSLNPQALLSVPLGGCKISALHVSNTDAELGGGVRKRVSSSEAEGQDGVFCTSDSVNVLDFRQPSGVGLKISKLGVNVQSVFSRGDSIFLGCTNSSSMGKQSSPLLQQFSLRRQGLFSTYAFPESNAHSHHAAISQVWGNSDFVMGVCGLGLHVFDAMKDDALRVLNMDYSNAQNVREVVGPDDLYWPSFDYLGSRALLISRDRPAMWRHLIV